MPISEFNFEVLEDCYVEQFDITITAGSITNLTSSPRWLWWLIPPHGETKFASVLHDYLIRNGYGRVYSDCVYLYFLLIAVPQWQAIGMFLVIRSFKKLRNKIEVSLIAQIQKAHGVSAAVAKKRLKEVRRQNGLKAFDRVTLELYMKHYGKV